MAGNEFADKFLRHPDMDLGMSAALQDSGQRRSFDTGSVRDVRDGKGRFDLVFTGWPRTMKELARHLEEGAKKYGDNNWKKGQPLSVYLDSELRHLDNALLGEMDEPHIIAHIWNALCLVETYLNIEDGRLPADLSDLGIDFQVYGQPSTQGQG